MRRIRIGAWLASAASALYLMRLAPWPPSGKPGTTWRTGPVKVMVPLIIVLAVAGYVLYLMFSGPHMRVEPKILPYQSLLPAMPEGIMPAAWRQKPNLESVRNPVADTAATRRIGQAYYRDYCVFCHGQAGHGDGPVGRSYVPTPTDLTTPAVQGLSDGALYRGMLTGIGHTPVLDYVVDPNAPWYIIHYVRSLRD
jgi:mono/diheme cytochrome c family protein